MTQPLSIGRSDAGLVRVRAESFNGAASILEDPAGRVRFTLAQDFRTWCVWRRVDGGHWNRDIETWPTLRAARAAALGQIQGAPDGD